MVRTLACLSLRSFCMLLQTMEAGDLRALRSCTSMTEVFDELWNDSAAFDLVLLDEVEAEADDLRSLPDSYPDVAFRVVGPPRIGGEAAPGNIACYDTFEDLLHHVLPSRGLHLEQAG